METEWMDEGIREGIAAFTDIIKNTSEYKDYEYQKEKVKRFPELKQQIDEFRRRNYELQNRPQSDNLMEDVECFQREYERFMEKPLVADFLQAELNFCRFMQEVNLRITEALDFE